MFCISCGKLSFKVVCDGCIDALKPSLSKRKLEQDFSVYSFFGYNEISAFLHTKHHPCGAYVYKKLAQYAYEPFLSKLENERFDGEFCLVPVDDKPKGGYSHTAVLVKALKYQKHFNILRSQNSVSYSGKSLAYRKKNPRNFKVTKKSIENVILVDDLITTGSTLQEAKKSLEKCNINVLFALTLADAKVK